MGYSCTAKAAEVLYTFRGCDSETGRGSSNTWEYKGHHYFYERGRENKDGAITGAIWAMDGRKVGTFRISPEGVVERASHGFRDKLDPVKGLANYYKIHEPRVAWQKACEFDGYSLETTFAQFSDSNPYA